MENTTVRGWVSSGIRVLRGSENRVENSTVEQTRFHGIVVEESSDTLVSGCTVRQSGYEVTASTGDGIVVFGGHDNRIEHSLVEQSHHHGIHVGDGEHDTLIVDNVSQYNGGDGLYFCWNVLRATVRGNDFHHNARHGIGSLGIGGDKGDRLNLVVGNVSRQNGVYGIEAVGGRANTIEDNVVLDNSQAAPGRYAGILLLDTLETTVRGNRSGGDAAPYAQRFGILETGRSDRNSITGNLCEGNGEAGVQIVGPLTFASGNVG